jgi:hypothetical protein
MAGAGLYLRMHFLDACSLCRRPLGDNCDIYMYRCASAVVFLFISFLPSLLLRHWNGALTSHTHACDSPANRGDIAFCSEECRSLQIDADVAAKVAAEKARAKKRPMMMHGPSTAREVDGPQDRSKVRDGSILAL